MQPEFRAKGIGAEKIALNFEAVNVVIDTLAVFESLDLRT